MNNTPLLRNRLLLGALGLMALGLCVSVPSLLAQDGGKKPGKEKEKDKEKDKDKDGGRKDGGKKDGGGKGDDGGKAGEEKGPYKVGDAVSDVTFELVGGGSWSAATARGKVTVLVWAAGWSAESFESLKRLGDPRGAVVKSGAATLGILRDTDATAAKKAVADGKIEGDVALDPKRKLYDRFAKKGLPYTVVLDASGKVALSESGFDESGVARKVEELKKK